MNTDLRPIDERDEEELEVIPEQAVQSELTVTLEGRPITIMAESLSKTFTYKAEG